MTMGGFGAVVGARYKPCPVIWPQAIPLHPEPERLQITTLLLVPLTVAVNCNWPPGNTPPGFGDRETDTAKAAASETTSRSASHAILNKRFMFSPLAATVSAFRVEGQPEPDASCPWRSNSITAMGRPQSCNWLSLFAGRCRLRIPAVVHKLGATGFPGLSPYPGRRTEQRGRLGVIRGDGNQSLC